jgi:hypothetical protein
MKTIFLLMLSIALCCSADNPFIGKWKWLESRSTDGTITKPEVDVIFTLTDKNITGKVPILGDINNTYRITGKNEGGFSVSVFYTKEESEAKETWTISNGTMTQKNEDGELLLFSFVSK